MRECEDPNASTTKITLDSADGGKSSYHFVRVYEREEE